MIAGLTAYPGMLSRAIRVACLVLYFAQGLAAAVRAAEPEGPPTDCHKCESINEVILFVGPVPNEARDRIATNLWMREMTTYVRRKYGNGESSAMPVIEQSVADTEDFRNMIQSLVDSCRRIKFLALLGHGSTGYLQLGHEGVSVENIASVFGNGMQCAMAQDAFVSIWACNVGRGCRGAQFMRRLAAELLPKGGALSAPEDYVVENALFGVAARSVYGRYRELYIDRTGLHSWWVRGTNLDPACAAQ